MSNLLKGVNLYLVGMMGSGKSTTGRILAAEMGYQFFDTDSIIERVAGQPITDIFAESGEATFRQLETQVLSELAAYRRLAIATGGGIVLQQANWSYLHHGIVVWLDVPVEQLYERLQDDSTRPLLQTPDPMQTLRALLEQRQHLYAQADVHVVVQPDESPQQLVQRILEQTVQVLKPESQSAVATDS